MKVNWSAKDVPIESLRDFREQLEMKAAGRTEEGLDMN